MTSTLPPARTPAVTPAPAAGLDLSGRRALVTGGGSGIGAACARRLAAAGAVVVVLDLSQVAAERVAEEVGGEPLVVDLADRDAVAACEAEIAGVDVLVNNAGLQHVAPIEQFPPERFAQLLAIMLEAPFRLVRAALPHMYARGWGRIVHVSSVHGLRASPHKSAYVAAKHGLEGLSKVIALEGGPHGVTSVTVCPGYVRTPLVEGQIAAQARVHGIPEAEVVEKVLLSQPAVKELIEPADVAELVAFLCGDAARFATGSAYVLDGGWSAR
jgi:3-hydroxybutyrate dehydrogenase